MNVQIKLSSDVASVLYDFLARSVDEQNGQSLQGSINHDAELRALNSLLGELEKQLTLSFEADYQDMVRLARDQLQQKSGEWPT